MLSEMRLLEAIETLWNLEDPDILSTTNDIFAFIVEANPSLVREFCLSEAKLGQVCSINLLNHSVNVALTVVVKNFQDLHTL